MKPPNLARLENLGAQFTWREANHDLVTACPKCGAKLVIDETEKFFIHFGPPGPERCAVDAWRFDEVIIALGRVKP